MPGFIAKKLCPKLVIVRPHFDKYSAVATKVREILADYDPLFSPIGLDEAYLDLTDYIAELLRTREKEEEKKGDLKENRVLEERSDCVDKEREAVYEKDIMEQEEMKQREGLFENEQVKEEEMKQEMEVDQEMYIDDCTSDESINFELPYNSDDTQTFSPLSPSYWSTALTVVDEIRSRIHHVTQLTASAGIGVNKMLAKIGSDINKPNGQFLVPTNREGIIDFVKTLPIRKVSQLYVHYMYM